MRLTKTPLLFTLLALLLAFAVGCSEDNTTFIESPTAPEEPVQIITSGRVVSPSPGVIACEDDSSTIPSGKIETIQWTVRAPSGVTADSGTSAVKGEITFSGLAAGDYTVEQEVILMDGRRGPPKTYLVTVS